jgi:hypothetical protein
MTLFQLFAFPFSTLPSCNAINNDTFSVIAVPTISNKLIKLMGKKNAKLEQKNHLNGCFGDVSVVLVTELQIWFALILLFIIFGLYLK